MMAPTLASSWTATPTWGPHVGDELSKVREASRGSGFAERAFRTEPETGSFKGVMGAMFISASRWPSRR